MDIEVIIKKTLVFTSLFTIVFGIFVSVALLVQQLIGAGNNMIGFAISSILIILIVRPLEDVLTNITNKYLFQKKYDYKQILKAFLDEVITVLSLDTIAKSTLELLDKALHPEIAVILLLNRFEDKYNSYQSLGQVPEISWDNKAVIPSFLKTTKDLLSIEKSSTATKVPDELKEEMGKYAAKIAIPLMLHNDMIGIILMGKKKSDEEYTQDDIDILTDLARTESVAVGNAQLFADTAQNERRAAIGTLAAGINHEVGNPLNIINTKMQVYLMSLERGLYKDKKPEEIIAEAGEIMKVCLQQTTRISEITKKLSSFAKPSKDFKPELTDIEEQIDDTLAVVGHDIELERIEIKKNIQKPLSKILSDKRQVQQILFNIIRNAGQAIKEKGVIEISAVDSSDGNVKIEISDTGHGIPEDKMDKIYEPFFTTKEPGKGTGLGLSIVRQLVWRNKGDIKVRSKVGEGTTFTITFPQAK
ncbi:MAG: ATP-binding protein [Candidatus Omnitrophota bacterium]